MTATKSRNQLAAELMEAIAYARRFHFSGDKDQRDQAIRSIEDKPGLSRAPKRGRPRKAPMVTTNISIPARDKLAELAAVKSARIEREYSMRDLLDDVVLKGLSIQQAVEAV
jgi:hypothetical protein